MEPKSLLTYDAEGRDDECQHMHWPGGVSGVTIGHGYDFGHRSADDVRQQLGDAGVAAGDIDLLVQACGLTGTAAKEFAAANRQAVTLDRPQMVALFNSSFDEQAAEVTRICKKADCVAAYGAVDLDALDQRIWLTLVDLKFRGDYHPQSRRKLQKHVADNDFSAFAEAMNDRDFWQQVPPDRFQRRVAFLNA